MLDWDWGGFATQGLSYSDANNFSGNSEHRISTDFRELALYTSLRAGNRVRFAGQLISRQAGKVSDGDPEIDYLLADVSLDNSASYGYGVRAGRLKLPFGFYNDTRDVAFTRPSIILPQSLYLDQARDLQLSADGVQFYGYFPIADLKLDFDLIITHPRLSSNVEYTFLGSDLSGHFATSSTIMSRLILADDAEHWRLGLTFGNYKLEYKPGPLNESGYQQGNIELNMAILGAQYHTEKWSFSGEYWIQSVDWSELQGIRILDEVNILESYYLQASYRFIRDWDFLFRYEELYLDRADRDGSKVNLLFGRPKFKHWAKDFTLGVGWQASPSLSFRGEWHTVTGAAWLSSQDNPVLGDLTKHWNLYLLQASYRF